MGGVVCKGDEVFVSLDARNRYVVGVSVDKLQQKYRAPLRWGGTVIVLLAFKTRFPDAGIWNGARDSCLEAFWYDCNFGNMRKTRGSDVTDTGMPERNL